MEPTLRSAQVLKQEAEDLGFEGKEILDYVKDQQKLDREERAEWRKIRMAELQGEDKKRADEIRIAQIGAEAEDKKRADELRQKGKRGLTRSVLLRLRLRKNKPR